MTINVQPQNVGAVTLFMHEMYSDLDLPDVPVGFQSFFGRGMGATVFVNNALQFNYDVERGDSTISKMLTRQTGGSYDLGPDTKSTKGERFTNKGRVFPIQREAMHVAFDDLFDRVPGEEPFISNPTDDMVLTTRLRLRFAKQIRNVIKRHMRRFEVACSEAIRTGKQTLDDGGFYDFDRSTNNTIAAPTVWTDANANIIEQIDNLCQVPQRNGKVPPNFLLPGEAAFAAMVLQLKIQTVADNIGFMFIRAGDQMILPALDANLSWMVAAGFNYVGWVQTFQGRKLPIFTYNKEYQDDAGDWQKIMPVDQVLAGYSEARCDRFFGPRITFPNNMFHDQAMNALLGFDFATAPMPMNLENPGVFDPRMFHIDGNVNEDNTAISARMVTGPVFVPAATDCFSLLTGVV